MDPKTAYAKSDQALFLDVREPYEWDEGHIEGALHIPMGQIAERFAEVPQGRPVVVVCQLGQRSALVTEFLNRNGYDAHNLEGGLELWSVEALPLVGS